MNLKEIAGQAEDSINSIEHARQLLDQTYGAGCVDAGSHHDADEIRKAVRTLVIHLSWLKARAITLSLMAEASDDSKKQFRNLVR